MALDLQPDEDGQAKSGLNPADVRAVPGDDPAGLQRLDPAQARGRRQRDSVREVNVGHPAVLLQRGDDGTIHFVWDMLWHETQCRGEIAQFNAATGVERGD